MKNLILLITLLCFGSIRAQNDTWYAFFDEEYNRGFKDAGGKVMIAPKFGGLTTALRFEAIIPVMDGDAQMYYLLKNGTRVGRDSVWTFDTMFDCESEGLIKFSGKDEKVGMFNSAGKVAIPAAYNALSRCHNGYIMALKGAEKSYWHKDEKGGCNHWSWTGGTNYLIDAHNRVVVENFNTEDYLDFYTAQVTDAPHADPVRVTYKCPEGYLSFIDNKKLFMQFLNSTILNNITAENLLANSYPKIIYWEDGPGWTGRDSKAFIETNFGIIKERLLALGKPGADYSVGVERNIICPDDMDADFEPYTDNCGSLNIIQYPLMEVVLTHRIEDSFYQDYFSFLKTPEGFKLLSITLRNAVVK